MNRIKRHIAMLLAIMVCAIWGETFVSSKILLHAGLMPADIFCLRFVMAYLCILFFSRKKLMADTWHDEMLLMLLGLFGGSLYFLTENMALMYSTASNVAILVGSTPVVTSLLMRLFYRQSHFCLLEIVGSLLAFAGLIMVVLNGQLVLHLNPRGDILALGASLTWGFYSVIITRLSEKYDSLFISRKVFFYGVITILPFFLLVEPLHFDLDVISQPEVWGNLVYLSLIASMVCYAVWNWCLKRLGTVRATNIIYLQTFFTMIFSAIILGERITLMAILGTVILIGGMIMALKKDGRRK